MKEIIHVTAMAIGVMVLVICLVFGAISFSVKMSTVEGSFVIYPENDKPFSVHKVTFMSSNSVVYTKPDGSGGRISGNFRVEDAPKAIEKEAANGR